MTTTVHLPPKLLKLIDRRAGELGVSRNRYIVLALTKAIEEETRWSPRFLKAITEAAKDLDSHRAIDDMMRAITGRRSRKRAPKL